jgi:hypothetical protein
VGDAGQGPVDLLDVHDRSFGLLHFHAVTLREAKGLEGIKKPSVEKPPEGVRLAGCRGAMIGAQGMSLSFPASQDWR